VSLKARSRYRVFLPLDVEQSALLIDRGRVRAIELKEAKEKIVRGSLTEMPKRRALTQFGVVRLRTFRRVTRDPGIRGSSATFAGSSPRRGSVAFSKYAKLLDAFSGKTSLGRAIRVKIVARGANAVEIEMLQSSDRFHSGKRFLVSEDVLHLGEAEGLLELLK
jgi:hypothetical protein